jgi:hypothetical protein
MTAPSLFEKDDLPPVILQATSVANPKFRKCLGNTPGEFRIRSHTSNLLNLVWFADLKFLNANAI